MVVFEFVFPLVDFGECVVLAAPDVLDHFLLSLPTDNEKCGPDCHTHTIDAVHWRVQGFLPQASFFVQIELVKKEQYAQDTRDDQPGLVVKKEGVGECILLAVVVLYHVYRLKRRYVVSTEPNEPFQEIHGILFKTLSDSCQSVPRVERIVRFYYLGSQEEIKVYLFTKELLNDGLLSDAVECVKAVLHRYFKLTLDKDGDLCISKSSITLALLGCLINYFLRYLYAN